MAPTGPQILVVRTGALGDTLMITPVFRALLRRQAGTAIDVLCSEAAAPLIEHHPAVRHVWRLRLRHLPLALSLEKRRIVRMLRSHSYDAAVLLETASGPRRLLERAGLRRILSFEDTAFDPALHAVVNNLRAAGVTDWQEHPQDLELFLTDRDRQTARRLLESLPRPLVGLHIGYGPRGKKRQQTSRLRGWSVRNFAALGRSLAEQGITLVLTGSAEDRSVVESLLAALPPGSGISLAGRTTPRELAAVIGELTLLVSVDSGPAHMAAALGTPLIVLWGPGILEQTRPLSSHTPIRIVREPVPCAPCYGTPAMKACRRNICMESITPETVRSHVLALLDQAGSDDAMSPARDRAAPGTEPVGIGCSSS